MARMTRSNMRPTVEEPLTEYEKVRDINMARNNRIFQSLSIDAIASMIRKTNDVQEVGTNEVQEGSGVSNDDPEYNPKEDEVIDGEEVDDVVEQKTVKFMSSISFSDVMTTKPRNRKGKGLERISKSLGTKVPIQIAEGMKRPEKPLQVAKLAFECGLVARSHLPVLPHREYKKANLLENYNGKFVANFEINTDSETIKIETCVLNKMNCEKVVYQQRTGSRHYTTHIFATKEERKGEELSAIDLFKATHNRKKHGFSKPVKIAILEMEERKDEPVPEGEESKSTAEIVDELLKTVVKQSTFLRNVGLQLSRNNSSKATAAMATHWRDLEQKLETSELKAEVMEEELAAIKMNAEEAEAAHDKELELLRQKSQEQDEKLAHLMALFGAKAS
uniref:Uncharacterized protein n=1 Tax=Aegilops tauschii TaxID=37682 RepID=M8BXG1_AEGTA